MVKHLGVLYILIFLLFPTYASGGFLDDLLEKGKEITDEINRSLEDIVQPNKKSPQRENPSRPIPQTPQRAPQRPSSTPTYQGLSDSEILNPLVRKALGYPVFARVGTITAHELSAMKRYVDYVMIGLVPDFIEQRAECFAANYLPQSELGNYLNETEAGGILGLREKGQEPQVPTAESLKEKFWKGNNEFERPRSKKAFLNDYGKKIQNSATPLPQKVAMVTKVLLPPYDFNKQEYVLDLRRIKGLHGRLNRHPEGWFLESGFPGICGGLSFKVPMPDHGKVIWKVSPEEAEKVESRLLKRQGYVGVIVEFAPSSESQVIFQPHLVFGISGSELKGHARATIKAIGWYEDQDLERLLHLFEGSNEQDGTQPVSANEPNQSENLEPSHAPSSVPGEPTPLSVSPAITIVPPEVRRIHGRPVTPSNPFGGMVLRKEEDLAFHRYVDFIDLGLTPNLFGQGAACFLEDHVSSSKWPEYLNKDIQVVMNKNQDSPIERMNWRVEKASFGPKWWRGDNEFDRRRTRQAFIETYQRAFEAEAVKLPLELIVITPIALGEYNMTDHQFSFQSSVPSFTTGSQFPFAIGRCGGLQLVSSRFTPPKWKIDLAKAEDLINRLPNRTVYWGTVVELSPETGEPLQLDNRTNIPVRTPRPLVRLTVNSMGLYEDQNLERLIHRFDVSQKESSPPASQSVEISSSEMEQSQDPSINFSKAAQFSNTPTSSNIPLPKVRRVKGKPVALLQPWTPVFENVLSKEEALSFHRYVDFMELGISPKLFQETPLCFAAVHLSPTEREQFLQMDSYRHFQWKGQNEFEQARTKQSFIEQYQTGFQSVGIKTPVELVVITPTTFEKYDGTNQSFDLVSSNFGLPDSLASHRAMLGRSVGNSRCGGLALLAPKFSPSKWKIGPQEAESLVNRIPSRTLYWGTILEFSGESEESTHTEENIQNPPFLKGSVKSMRLYEDQHLQRLAHDFDFATFVSH